MAAEPTALELHTALAEGRIGAGELVGTCLARIDETEGDIHAWAHLDPAHARAQAEGLDRLRRSGQAIGPLHGLPVGIKDIIDVRGMPCENGTPLDAGRRPAADASLVKALRAAGALILGKTVTTELAYFQPRETRNPHDLERTPGGSSSGSAAAVAAGMVPLAIGSQTNGSVIRPASFCGVVGFKPTRGLIPTDGVLRQAPSLDTIGVFARNVADAALLADVIAIADPSGFGWPIARPALLETASTEPPLAPVLAFVKTSKWPDAEPDTIQAFDELIERLGEHCDLVELPEVFASGHAIHRCLNYAEMARYYRRYVDRGREQLSAKLLAAYDEGMEISARDYMEARDAIEVLAAGISEIFTRYDAIVTPAACGEAPRDPTTTGDPGFCTLWTLSGAPAVTLPLLAGSHGMPMGVQLVGERGQDARLLRTARWLERELAAPKEG